MSEKSEGAIAPQPLVRFIQLIKGARAPRRADRSVGGTLPVRALRYCEPVCVASQFGYHLFLPLSFRLLWDGHAIFYQLRGMDRFEQLDSIYFPGFDEEFETLAPPEAVNLGPPFITAGIQPGYVQLWAGSLVSTAPGWHSLLRPVANLARPSGYELFDGIVQTDSWLGPLFINIRLTRTDMPIDFYDDVPFMQLQPVKAELYSEKLLSNYTVAEGLDQLTPEEWKRYMATVGPTVDPQRRQGTYAARVRSGKCPIAAE